MTGLDIFGLTDVGRVRAGNEDHFVIASIRKSVTISQSSLSPAETDRWQGGGAEAVLLAVADGVGGRPGGELASGAVVTGLLGYVGRAAGCYQQFSLEEEHQFLERLEQTVRDTHEELLRVHGESEKAPATTLTLAVLVGRRAYLIHVGEGLDQAARDEFTALGTITTTAGCLYAPQTAVTHGTSFGAAEFAIMKSKSMKLTWSPASNIALYGATTNIPMALDNGILVSLAPDWSMGGSQNMLDEVRFAKKFSDANWGGRLKAKDIVDMATKNAATVLGLSDKIGTLKKGMLADLFVVRGTRATPYDAVTAASAKDVILTMVGGKVLYGDVDLRVIASAGAACEDFDTCGSAKFLCVTEPGKTADKLNQTYAQIHAILEAAMKDMDTVRPAGIGPNFSPVAPVVACPK